VLYGNNIKLKEFPLRENIAGSFPALPVSVINDASAAALAEYRLGAGKGAESMVMLTLGTGLGCAVIIDGKLLSGRNGCAAGGHIVINTAGAECSCGNFGCLESYASATALTASAETLVKRYPDGLLRGKRIDGEAVFAAAAANDAAAREAVGIFIANLGAGIVSVMNLLRPDIIVLGGGISEAGGAFLAPLREYVSARIFADEKYAPFELVTARLRISAGIIGAAISLENGYKLKSGRPDAPAAVKKFIKKI
jgi:glucokinase